MKVIYEISHLGVAHRNHGARTGIVRVIENVACELASNPELDLTFCSNKDRQTLEYTLAYIQETKDFSSVPFSKPPFLDLRLKNTAKRNKLIQIVNSGTLNFSKKLALKMQIKELILFENFFKSYNNDLVHPRDLKNADIFHSSFYPIPHKASRIGKKINFLTCYDLIPIIFPQYFEPEIIELMNTILQSITPETWVLCISASTRNDLLNHLGCKVDAQKVIVTELAASNIFYKCTDKDKTRLIKSKHHIPDGQYVLSLCTFEPRKNIDQVIKAFAKLIKQDNIKDLYLVLVGTKGWLFERIFEEIARSPEVKSRIVITGFVADEDLAALYTEALMFVYPSFYEGFGLPPLEAMKCGTPVITSNTSSLPEVVGDAGIMVDPSDLDALCDAMEVVYKSPSKQQQMSAKSLERASLFNWERCGKETFNAYKSSLL